MLLIRLLFFALIAFLAYRIYRLLVAPRRAPDETAQRIEGEEMVRCEECGLHIPKHLAIGRDSLWFCSAEHRERHRESDGGEH